MAENPRPIALRRLTVQLFFAASLLLTSSQAFAQKAVLFFWDGDPKGKLRGQVLQAVEQARELEIVPLDRYRSVAKRKKLKGKRAYSPAGIAKVAPVLGVAVLVDGRVSGRAFKVTIRDPKGAGLWSKSLPVSRGLLSADNARRLAAAIGAAAGSAGGGRGRPAEDEVAEAPSASEQTDDAEEAGEAAEDPGASSDPMGGEVAEAPPARRGRDDELRDDSSDPVSPPVVSAAPDEPAEPDELAPPRVTRRVARASVTGGPKAPILSLQVAGTTTWRNYCSRPGVSSCQAFNPDDPNRAPGDTVDFATKAPYAGFGVALELFPLGGGPTQLLRGLGLVGNYSRGFSLTKVTISSSGSAAPERQAVSVDEAYTALATYRYLFNPGSDEALVGYGGLRFGIAARNFEVDADADVPLLGSHRQHPVVGLEGAYPFSRLVRAEAVAMLFLNPRASGDEVQRYGASSSGSGFALEAGISGDLFGPFGYVFRARLARYQDKFIGQGTQWLNGGAAEETYTGLFWGLAARF